MPGFAELAGDDICAVLLAAGAGSRFGGNKLEADFEGLMLGEHSARAMAECGFRAMFVVENPAHVRLSVALAALGFGSITNIAPQSGIAHSLLLATRAAMTTEATGMMVVLADMPRVTAAHLHRLCQASCTEAGRITASVTPDGTRSPPALFPRALWPKLLSLKDDRGAGVFLADAILVAASRELLTDIDCKDEISAISAGRKLTKDIS